MPPGGALFCQGQLGSVSPLSLLSFPGTSTLAHPGEMPGSAVKPDNFRNACFSSSSWLLMVICDWKILKRKMPEVNLFRWLLLSLEPDLQRETLPVTYVWRQSVVQVVFGAAWNVWCPRGGLGMSPTHRGKLTFFKVHALCK